MELTGAQYGALGVVNDHGRIVEFHHRGVPAFDADRIGDPPVGRGILGGITRHGTVIRVDDMSDHAGYSGLPTGHPSMASFLGVPVRVSDKAFGNLYVTEKPGDCDRCKACNHRSGADRPEIEPSSPTDVKRSPL
jgi:GAF domain-containing protein